jgi:hypothetical protein
MKPLFFILTFSLVSLSTSLAQQSPNPPLFGKWKCHQIIDYQYVVNDSGWTENYSSRGYSNGTSPVQKFTVRMLERDKRYVLSFGSQGSFLVDILTPYMMIRATEEHAYACMKISS